MELGDRKKTILKAIVDDYIITGEPVGSRTISKKYKIGISSATIRNEMSDLEDMGLLEQPHTSAGRIPSDKGYRLYVDQLMEIEYPSYEETACIKNLLHLATINEMDEIIRRTTKLLSEITKYTSAMLSPSVKKSTLKSIQLIKVDSTNVVAVIITDTCLIKNVVVRVPEGIESDALNKINNMLNTKLPGRTIEEITPQLIFSIQNEMVDYKEIFKAIIPAIYESLNSNECEVYLEGATNIFEYPEYSSDMSKAKNFLSIIENKDVIFELFSDGKKSFSVSIGEENGIEQVKDCSVIKASYKVGGKDAGKIGIIGPTRMNYSKVTGILKFIAYTLNNMLNNNIDENKNNDKWGWLNVR